MAKILLLEDDEKISVLVADALQKERHVVDTVGNVAEAADFLKTYTYDLLILDWQLPDGEGVDLCKSYKSGGGASPVLMLTGKDALQDKTTGLDSGADDYVTKPFAMEEISARIRALLRRLPEETITALTFHDIEVDSVSHVARINGKQMRLSPRELALLECLISSPGTTASHHTLRSKVWWDEPHVERNTVNAMVARLRRKLQDAGSSAGIRAVSGEGFALEKVLDS